MCHSTQLFVYLFINQSVQGLSIHLSIDQSVIHQCVTLSIKQSLNRSVSMFVINEGTEAQRDGQFFYKFLQHPCIHLSCPSVSLTTSETLNAYIFILQNGPEISF